MPENISRRKFIKKSSAFGIAAIVSHSLINNDLHGQNKVNNPDLTVVEGSDVVLNTQKAIELLGGMKRFVPKGSKVGLLINSDFETVGTYVDPDIALETIKLCFESGAAEVTTLQNVKPEYWTRSKNYDKYTKYISLLKNIDINAFPAKYSDEHWAKVTPQKAAVLKDAEVIRALLGCDVFINIPIAKHHASTFLTCAIKNIMGVFTRKTNVNCHLGSGVKNDPVYLAQSLADMHLIKRTNLCVVDAMEILSTNGPEGPGKNLRPSKVIAGPDIVAVDSYCAGLLNYKVDDILSIDKAYKHGLGEKNLGKINLLETKLT